jgi:hypothetical protein
MKPTSLALSAILLLTALTSSTRAQNLLTNGDFETNVLTPWTPSGTVSLGSSLSGSGGGQFACFLGSAGITQSSGTITQAVVTKTGSTYYLALDAGSASGVPMTLSATPAVGNAAPDGTRQFTADTTVGPTRLSLIFTASTVSTAITIQASTLFTSPSVDNIVLLELPANPHAGRYTGLLTTDTGIAADSLDAHVATKVVARIKPTGQILIVQGGTAVTAGIIFPDGSFTLRVNSLNESGNATFHGNRVTLKVTTAPSTLDEGSNEVDFSQSTTYTLTKSGK